MWNKRYAQKEYFYGKQPNEFFRKQLLKFPPGRILLPAEGEGRNAVFAALSGWDVVAFDTSTEAKKKAEKLAKENKVQISYSIISNEEAEFEENTFDIIALIFAHHSNRHKNHQKFLHFLKPGGQVILEGFSKNQINNNTGGPPVIELLFSKEELQSDFVHLREKKILELDILLNEGAGHTGIASVIRLTGRK